MRLAHKLIGLVMVSTLALPAASKTSAPLTQANVEAWLDGILPYAMDRSDIAGTTVIVIKDNQVLLQKGYGVADVATHRPVDAERTLFRMGSITKLFTWTAVMQLVEQHRLDLDADINSYLDFKIPPYEGRPVTMRNLMTHTAGFEETGKNLIAYDPRDALSLDAYIHQASPARIFPSGEVTAYSNYGAALAGYIVQRVSGERYEDYIERHILTPLGMQHASVHQPLPPTLTPLLSSGYRVASGATHPFEFVSASPAGSGSASGSDIARFMIEHLQAERGAGKGILRPDTAREMHASAHTNLSPSLHRMMLGFFEIDRNGHRIIGHGGDTAWFHSNLYLWPDDGVGLFVVVNSLGKDDGINVLRTLLFEQFSDRYLPGPGPEGTVDPHLAQQHAALIAGQYVLSRRNETNFLSLENLLSQVEVSADTAGQLSIPGLAVLSGQERKFREIAPFVWREVHGVNRLAARVSDGKVQMVSEDEISPAMFLLPPKASQDARWLLPLFLTSLGILTLTAIIWAVSAGLRRYYGVQANHGSTWVRAVCVAAPLLMACWIFAIFQVGSRSHLAAWAFDPALIGLHFLSWIIFPTAAILTVWNAVASVRARASWRAMLWNLCLSVSCLTLLWVALSFHLIGASLQH